MRVYLIGFMGSGKSTAGRMVAPALRLDFVDLDAEIERTSGESISRLFARAGEDDFRRRERAALEQTMAHDRCVVATGGGCFVLDANRELIQRAGISVWLDVPFDRILARMSTAGRRRRPLLSDRGRAEALYSERLPVYAAADHRIKLAGDETPESVAATIVALLRREHECAT